MANACGNQECYIKTHCKLYNVSETQILGSVSREAEKAECNWYWPTDALLGNPGTDLIKQKQEFNPQTKNHRRRKMHQGGWSTRTQRY